ncbi:PHP domain-containing protein [bacterium]|nr:PHP domain-containing protein [candidate division CSSED10-310 bacterium]
MVTSKTSGSLPPNDLPMKYRVNLHVHSAFSDGQFTPEALVIQAISRGITVLGITDHYYTSKTLSITPSRLQAYLDELDRLTEVYSGRIRILKGIEINTLELFILGRELPPVPLLDRLDYVLLEYIANIPRAGIPILHAALIAQEIPVPTGLAHTDLPMAFPGMEPEDLINRLIQAKMFLELNETYSRPGERHPFYKHYSPYLSVAQSSSLRFSAGTDTHGPVVTYARSAMSFLQTFNLADRLFFF